MAPAFVSPAQSGQINADQDSELLLRNGFDALSDKQPDEARQFFERIIRLYPQSRAATAAGHELERMKSMDFDATESASDDPSDDAPADDGHAAENEQRIRKAFVVAVGDRVFFAENSAVLGGRARSVLESQARWLKSHPDVKIKIVGRSDDGGAATEDQALSAKRAEAVRNKLVEVGVPSKRLEIEPRGRQDPVATCRSPLCQAQNRHVETLISLPGGMGSQSAAERSEDGRKDAAASQPMNDRALPR